MPIESVQNFNEKFNAALDEVEIKTSLSNILSTFSDNELRMSKIKEYVKNSFPTIAAAHEQNRQQSAIYGTGISVATDAKDLLNGYLGVVTALSNVASTELADQMKAAQNEAKKSAEALAAEAEKARQNALKARENRTYGANKIIEDANALVQKANLRRERANDDAAYRVEPWAPSMENFGLSSTEAHELLLGQVNSVTYSDVRRQQMRFLGVKDPLFMNEVNALSGAAYADATPEAKEKMHQIYVTRELMQARLARHNWLWKLVFRGQTKAMNNYIQAADRALTSAGFPDAAKTEAMRNASNGMRLGASEFTDAMEDLKTQFAANDKEIQSRERQAEEKKALRQQKKTEKEQKVKEEKEKATQERANKREQAQKEKDEKLLPFKEAIKGREAEIKAEVDQVAATKAVPDAFFEIRFRPSFDEKASKEQSGTALNIAKQYIEGKSNLPAGVKQVFLNNYAKIRAVRNFLKNEAPALQGNEAQIQAKQEELSSTFSAMEEKVKHDLQAANIEYKPITYDQLQLRSWLTSDFETKKDDPKQVSQLNLEVPKKGSPSKNP